MSERLRDILTVAVIVAVLLLVLWGVLALRRGGAAVSPPPASSAEGAEAPRRTLPPVAAKAPATRAEGAVGAPKGGQPAASLESGTKVAAADATEVAWSKRQPADFTPEDLAQCGRGVRIDLGTYEVASGGEFAVQIGIASPALESCTLVVQYDKGALALVPGSVAPVGPQFRSGVEGYAVEASGKLVVIQTGTPGRKNLDGSVGANAAVAFRMRALRPGAVRLTVLPESSFSNARGDDEAYDVAGGEISIR